MFGCAKIQPPPGGPEDHTPPTIIAAIPATGSINVARDLTVRIEFSEPVVKDKLEAAIYISPHPPGNAAFGGGKKTIDIRWSDSLEAGTTYIMTVAAQISDVHGNRLRDPCVLAFSTGPAIDSGSVSGTVFDGDQPAANTQVLLFRLPLDSANAVFAPPDYITESGADGGYLFSYLPSGPYRAVALLDKNKNRELDAAEKYGVGAFDVLLTAEDHAPPPLSLYLQDVDTTRFELKQARVNQDRVLQAKFSHGVDSASVESAAWTLIPAEDSRAIRIVAVAPDVRERTSVNLLLTGAETGVSYRLKVEGLFNNKGVSLDTACNTAEFFWPTMPDTTAPTVTKSSPEAGTTGVATHERLHLWFSEPVDTVLAQRGFYVADSAGNRLTGKAVWFDSWEMAFTPGSDLAGGMRYLLVLDSASLVDIAGNTSISRWAADFTTLDPNDLGAITGSLSVLRTEWSDVPVVIDIVALGQKAHTQSMTFSGSTHFAFDLPADRYILRATVDLNRNGHFDLGSLVPYAPAEPRYTFPDTVDVRARFTTEGVNLTVP